MSEISENFSLWDKVTLRPSKLINQAADLLPVNARDELIIEGLKDVNFPKNEINAATIEKLKTRLSRIKKEILSHSDNETNTIEDLVALVELVAASELKEARLPGNRSGACGFCSSLVAVAAESCGYEASIYQVYKLNEMRHVSWKDSYQHAFNIITDRTGKRYIVDLSRVQFDNIDGTMVGFSYWNDGEQVIVNNNNQIKDFPAIEKINNTGYVELDDKSLNEYMSASTNPAVITTEFTCDTLEKATPLLLDHRRSNILGLVKVVK